MSRPRPFVLNTVMLDACTLICLGETSDPRHLDARAAMRHLHDEGVDLLLAAPALAELNATHGPFPTHIEIVAFGYREAEHLRTFMARYIEVNPPSEAHPKGYWKFDAMIAACAHTSGADAFLTLDRRARGVIAEVASRVRIIEPLDVISAQLDLLDED